MVKQFFFLLVSIFIGLTSCSTGTNGSNASSAPNTVATTAAIQISTVSTIPSGNFTIGENVPVNISNDTDDTLTLQDTQITANEQTISASAVNTYFLMANCQSIAPHSSCTARAFTNPIFQSYLLNLTYFSSSGKTYQVNQVISFNKLLPAQNGFIYDSTQLNSNFSGLTIPFRLAADYSKITVLVNDQDTPFSCYKNSYSANTLCSVDIKSNRLILGSGASNTLKISGYTNGNNTPITNTILTLTNTQTANIISSGQNVIINPDDGTKPQTVYLVNNGLVAATSLSIIPKYPIDISSNTCGTSLSAGASCSFVINVSSSPVSGQSSVGVSYSNGQSLQVIYFNVSYLNQTGPALTLTSSGNFTNLAVNGGPFYTTINVTNSGNVSLTNMQFSNVNLQESNMNSFVTGSSCYNGITLNTGQNCLMVLAYQPLVVKSSSINLIPIASYVGGGGESRTYANSILNIAYSAVSFATFTAMGYYGTTLTSTNNPPTTWTSKKDSPFATSSESATGLTINNGIYVIMKNTGVIESSTQNGLFWRQSGTNNFSSSTCDVVYDGTAYYTCGTVGTAFTGCATTGRGCIIKSTDLVTWTGLFQPAQAVPINNIYYYTNGTNNAYIATVASTTANTGLAVSTNGTTFVAPTSTGTTAANSNLMGTAFNTSNNTITAWSSTGFNTTVGIASITGSWTANTTNRPAASPVHAAIFQNGIYTVATESGNIYTATTSTGTYTQVFTGTSRINSITYGNSIYLAAQDSGMLESRGAGGWASITRSFGVELASSVQKAYFESVNNRFWVTGANTVIYSPATSTPSWQAPAIDDVFKNGTTYIAVDGLGNIYSSTSLTDWTTLTNPSGKILNYVTCPQSNICFAVGESGVILKSTNNTTWVQQSSPVPTNIILNSIACNFNTCVAGGGNYSSGNGTIATTNDFTNWTLQTSTLTTLLRSIAYYDTNQIFIGTGFGLATTGYFYNSPNNGTTWQQYSINYGGTTTFSSYSTTCSNMLGCISVGSGNSFATSVGAVNYSANGVIWPSNPNAFVGTSSALYSVAYNGVFVAVGDNGTRLYYSTNGSTWNSVSVPATNTTGLTTVTSN